ncbi:MAG: hypothetical protein HBSAPP03_06950 [Phycisphaerae bacterium]|nr:MAG: hypothetical protein HBSAPP03_06950 [Phycisphaerae bacterium]
MQRDLPAPLEVLVGIDGQDDAASFLAASSFRPRAFSLRVLRLPRLGPGATRNALAAHALAPLAWLLNDDVIPHPTAASRHLAAHADLARPALVLGSAPWRIHLDDTAFDRLLRESSMIFFYHRMIDPDPSRDWGFRHAWSLNLSCPTRSLREHPFLEMPGHYGYDDLEFAFRAALPILFRPEAAVTHDHRLTPADYLHRERALGRAAHAYARANPAFASALFQRNILDPLALADLDARTTADAPRLRDLARWFHILAHLHPDHADLDEAYQRHLPLKRFAWAVGLLHAADLPLDPVLTDPIFSPPQRPADSSAYNACTASP